MRLQSYLVFCCMVLLSFSLVGSEAKNSSEIVDRKDDIRTAFRMLCVNLGRKPSVNPEVCSTRLSKIHEAIRVLELPSDEIVSDGEALSRRLIIWCRIIRNLFVQCDSLCGLDQRNSFNLYHKISQVLVKTGFVCPKKMNLYSVAIHGSWQELAEFLNPPHNVEYRKSMMMQDLFLRADWNAMLTCLKAGVQLGFVDFRGLNPILYLFLQKIDRLGRGLEGSCDCEGVRFKHVTGLSNDEKKKRRTILLSLMNYGIIPPTTLSLSSEFAVRGFAGAYNVKCLLWDIGLVWPKFKTINGQKKETAGQYLVWTPEECNERLCRCINPQTGLINDIVSCAGIETLLVNGGSAGVTVDTDIGKITLLEAVQRTRDIARSQGYNRFVRRVEKHVNCVSLEQQKMVAGQGAVLQQTLYNPSHKSQQWRPAKISAKSPCESEKTVDVYSHTLQSPFENFDEVVSPASLCDESGTLSDANQRRVLKPSVSCGVERSKSDDIFWIVGEDDSDDFSRKNDIYSPEIKNSLGQFLPGQSIWSPKESPDFMPMPMALVSDTNTAWGPLQECDPWDCSAKWDKFERSGLPQVC